MAQEIKKAWDENAEKDWLRATLGVCRSRYTEFFGDIEHFPFQFTECKKGMKVLEVGCGWGRATVVPAKLEAESFGIDISSSFASLAKSYAKKKGCYLNLVVACAESLPFREKIFDAVHSWFVLQHMSKENAGKTIKEVWRVLKQGGKFHVQLPNRFGSDELVDGFIQRFKKPVDTFSYVRYYTLPEIKRLFNDFRPVVVHALEFRPPKYLFLLFPRNLLRPLRKLSDLFEKLANSKLPFFKNFICTDFIVVAKKFSKHTL